MIQEVILMPRVDSVYQSIGTSPFVGGGFFAQLLEGHLGWASSSVLVLGDDDGIVTVLDAIDTSSFVSLNETDAF